MKPYLLILLAAALAGCTINSSPSASDVDFLTEPSTQEQANWERYVDAAEEYYRKGRPHLVAIEQALASKQVHEIRIGEPHLHVQWQADGNWSPAPDNLQQRLYQPFHELAIFAASSNATGIRLIALPTTHFHPTKDVLATFYFAPMPDRVRCVPAEMASLATGACSLPLDDGWFLDVLW